MPVQSAIHFQMTVLFLVVGVPEFSNAVKDYLFSGRQFI